MALYSIDPEENRRTGERTARWDPETAKVNADEMGHYFQARWHGSFEKSFLFPASVLIFRVTFCWILLNATVS